MTRYDFLVIEWLGQGRELDHRTLHLSTDCEADEEAQNIAGEFYDVDIDGNAIGTPVSVIIVKDGEALGVTVPLAKPARLKDGAELDFGRINKAEQKRARKALKLREVEAK